MTRYFFPGIVVFVICAVLAVATAARAYKDEHALTTKLQQQITHLTEENDYLQWRYEYSLGHDTGAGIYPGEVK
jgi:nucleoside recognition membrane protein YjiH